MEEKRVSPERRAQIEWRLRELEAEIEQQGRAEQELRAHQQVSVATRTI
jgi:hypothetical protein